MPSYIQIGDDPTKWWLSQPIEASQLTGQPLSVGVTAPVTGTLVLSGKFASVVVFDQASGAPSQNLDVPAQTIYVPTTAGISAGHVGYELPASADLATLASQSATAMQGGHSQTVTLGGNSAGGTLVLNGATLSFVVLCKQYSPPPPPVAVGDGAPHH
jgi:hypothetical protein